MHGFVEWIFLLAYFLMGIEPKLMKTQTTDSLQTSPPFYPSPWMTPGVIGWEDAYSKAKDFVGQLTLLEKVNLTTGVG